MPEHHTPLITTIAAGLVLAYAFGLLAHRLRVPVVSVPTGWTRRRGTTCSPSCAGSA